MPFRLIQVDSIFLGGFFPSTHSRCLSVYLQAADMWSGVGSGRLWGRKREKRIKGEEAWQLVGLVPGQLKLPIGVGGGATEGILGGSAQTWQLQYKVFHCCHLRSFESCAVMLGMFYSVLETSWSESTCVRLNCDSLFVSPLLIGCGHSGASNKVGLFVERLPCDWLKNAPVTALYWFKCLTFFFKGGGTRQRMPASGPVGRWAVKGPVTDVFIGCFSFKTVQLKKKKCCPVNQRTFSPSMAFHKSHVFVNGVALHLSRVS